MVFIGMSDALSAGPLRVVARETELVGVIESTGSGLACGGLPRHFADRRGLPFFLLNRNGERAQSFLQRLKPDLVCVAVMAQRLRPEEFNVPRLGTINVHPSLLPKYRGPRPVLWQSRAMDLQGGVTIHRVDDGIDTGAILHQRRFPIPLGVSYPRLRARTFRAASDALRHAIRQLQSGQAVWRSQKNAGGASYARFPEPGEKLVDWNWPIERVWHFLRSVADEYSPLAPAAGMHRWLVGKIDRSPACHEPGTIAQDQHGPYVAHSEGRIRLSPQPPRGFWEEKLYWWRRRFRQKWEWR